MNRVEITGIVLALLSIAGIYEFSIGCGMEPIEIDDLLHECGVRLPRYIR
jgi:hypothetical protein